MRRKPGSTPQTRAQSACGDRSCIRQEPGGTHHGIPGRYYHKWESRPRQDMTICRCPPEQVPINLFHFYICAVLSGNGIALLLTPGTGISKPLMVNKRHDTDGRWRQVTKLPRPCPQYPPFTLRYGNMTGPSFAGGSWRFRHYHCRSQALRVPARAFDVILLTGQDRGRSPPCPAWPAGSRRARAWAACRSLGPAQRKKLEY